jgi:alginate O-acetyltransferase complex protein AlgI
MQRANLFTDHTKILSILLILIGFAGLLVSVAVDVIGSTVQTGLGPNQVALGLSGAAILTTGFIFLVSIELRKKIEWVLVLISVVAVAFSSDMFVIGGLPSWPARGFLLLSIGISITLSRIALLDPHELGGVLDRYKGLSIDWITISKFSLLILQLGLLVAVMALFKLENQALYHNLMLITFFGFILNFIFPMPYRLTFFLMLSLAAILGLFGFSGGIWMIAIGMALIGLCNLPIGIPYRIALLLVVVVVLILARAGLIPSPIPAAIWPILGSMFMFRMIVYLYDLAHQRKDRPVSPAFPLAYFFLLPNLVFPLFPVVDYSNFHKKYYDRDETQIYQTGVRWIMFGVIQLIAYRFVNYYLVISPQEVANIGDLVQYLVTNFMLIIRITGQFHLAVGILLMFGFNLPIANNRYFLATSFNDFWRKANIYWKDFMVKVFYYPSYFRMKRFSDTFRLVVATVFVFFLTWAFHSYQWFWLRGSILFTAPDILYWSIFGILILTNSLYESRHGRKRSLGKPAWSFWGTTIESLKVLGLFSVICILWGLWTSPTVSEYTALWSAVLGPINQLADLAPILVVVICLVIAKFWFTWLGEENQKNLTDKRYYFRTATMSSAWIFIIFALGLPVVQSRMKGPIGEVASNLTVSRLSSRDADLLLRGYYEDLVGVNRFNTELWEVYNNRPSDWPLIQNTEAAHMGSGMQLIVLNPSVSIDFHGARFTTNSWGMRDKDYDKVPAVGTYRIALLGPSFVMGSGVADQETFEWLLEDRVNADNTNNAINKYEILNFGNAGDSVIEEMDSLETRVMAFQPDALFIVAHQAEMSILIRNLANHFAEGTDIPYDFLVEIGRKAGVDSSLPETEIERRLQPYREELTQQTYKHITQLAENQGIPAIWIFMPTPEENLPEADISSLFKIAEDAGFQIVSLRDLYDGQDLDRLIVAEWDRHPNAIAHKMIADLMYQRIFVSGLIP